MDKRQLPELLTLRVGDATEAELRTILDAVARTTNANLPIVSRLETHGYISAEPETTT